MTSVKWRPPADELQVPLLMGLLFREVAGTLAAEEWQGLRQSHFRVISAVPPEGVSVTDLADRVGMTKQGCGQFVTHLAGLGHLRTAADPNDGRVRLVFRTPSGERVIGALTRRLHRIEEGWSDVVGPRRYATFRRVLEELALRD